MGIMSIFADDTDGKDSEDDSYDPSSDRYDDDFDTNH